jgi:hypothetical protein
MIDTPQLVNAQEFRPGGTKSQNMQLHQGQWYFMRDLRYQGWSPVRRIVLAWGVFTGKYDALTWELDRGDKPQGPNSGFEVLSELDEAGRELSATA